MRKCLIPLTLSAIVGMSPALSQGDEESVPQEPATLGQAIRDADVSVGLRYRVEQSDDDAFDDAALASTLRTSLKLQTKAFRGFSFLLEAEEVTPVGNDSTYRNLGYGGLDNGVRDRPVIADPALTAINQAAAKLERGPVAFTLGRTELLIGDQRFVGAVGWRQHHQAFDAAALDGSRDAGAASVLWELQYAVQSDWADHPGSVDLDYQKTGIGFTRGDISVRAVREALDGDGTYGFRTPLATLHGFNGWTDKFLGTPANGLVDVYLRLDHNLDTWNWTVRWHQFRSAVGSMDYGTEIDAMAVWNTPWAQDFGIKLAQYDADGFGTDTFKVWVWTSWNVSLRSAGGR